MCDIVEVAWDRHGRSVYHCRTHGVWFDELWFENKCEAELEELTPTQPLIQCPPLPSPGLVARAAALWRTTTTWICRFVWSGWSASPRG